MIITERLLAPFAITLLTMAHPITIKYNRSIYLVELGQEIRRQRLQGGRSTMETAMMAQIPRTMIDRIEAGDPDVPIGAYLNLVAMIDAWDGSGSGWGFEFKKPSNALSLGEPFGGDL